MPRWQRLAISGFGAAVVVLTLFGAMAIGGLLLFEGRAADKIPILPLFGDFDSGDAPPPPDFIR